MIEILLDCLNKEKHKLELCQACIVENEDYEIMTAYQIDRKKGTYNFSRHCVNPSTTRKFITRGFWPYEKRKSQIHTEPFETGIKGRHNALVFMGSLLVIIIQCHLQSTRVIVAIRI